MPTMAGSTATTPFRSPTTTTRRTWASATCASSTKTGSPPAGLRHAWPPGHGDRHLRARRRARSPGQHGQRQGRRDQQRRDPPRRRAADERRNGRDAQRVQPCQGPRDHFLQIWILPQVPWHPARATSRSTSLPTNAGQAAHRGLARRPGRVGVHERRRVDLRRAVRWRRERASRSLDPQRLAYVHVARGEIDVNGHRLSAGDAATLDGETQLELNHGRDAEVLVFDLARPLISFFNASSKEHLK